MSTVKVNEQPDSRHDWLRRTSYFTTEFKGVAASGREEHRDDDWGNILFNTTIAAAIADRPIENSEIFLLGGDSLRKANKGESV